MLPWLSIAYPTHAQAITARDIHPIIAYKLALMPLLTFDFVNISSLDEFHLEKVSIAPYNWVGIINSAVE